MYSAFIEVGNGSERFTVEFVAAHGFYVHGCAMGMERPRPWASVKHRFGLRKLFSMTRTASPAAPTPIRGGSVRRRAHSSSAWPPKETVVVRSNDSDTDPPPKRYRQRRDTDHGDDRESDIDNSTDTDHSESDDDPEMNLPLKNLIMNVSVAVAGHHSTTEADNLPTANELHDEASVPEGNVQTDNVPTDNMLNESVPTDNMQSENVPTANMQSENVPTDNVVEVNVPEGNVAEVSALEDNVPPSRGRFNAASPM